MSTPEAPIQRRNHCASCAGEYAPAAARSLEPVPLVSHHAKQNLLARGALAQAIDAYLKGFEADWRDAYTGVNAVTLMELKDPPGLRQAQLLPVLRYAVERKIARGNPDYWDYATLVELALIARREDDAIDALTHALSLMREIWEGESTARNLVLLRTARHGRGDHLPSAPRGHHDAGRGPLRVPHVGDWRDAGA